MISEVKEPTKLAAGVYTKGAARINNEDVAIAINGDQCELRHESGTFIFDVTALKSALGIEGEKDRPQGLIPAENSSADKFPFESIPGDEKVGKMAAQPLGILGKESEAWQEFRDTGLPLLVNQLLHAWGYALVFFNDEGEGLDCVPKRVEFRGFEPADMDEAYKKIAIYMKNNADSLLKDVE